MVYDRLSYRSLQWLVFVCVAVHNLEEGLAMGTCLPKIKETLGELFPSAVVKSLPGLAEFRIGLVGAALLPLVLSVISTTGRLIPFKPYLVATISAVLLLNVFVPHVPAAVVLGGYAPGVVTAILINLPFSVYFLRRSLREGHVSRRGLAATLALALGILALGLPLLFVLL